MLANISIMPATDKSLYLIQKFHNQDSVSLYCSLCTRRIYPMHLTTTFTGLKIDKRYSPQDITFNWILTPCARSASLPVAYKLKGKVMRHSN